MDIPYWQPLQNKLVHFENPAQMQRTHTEEEGSVQLNTSLQ
jgi:hypothetical protein